MDDTKTVRRAAFRSFTLVMFLICALKRGKKRKQRLIHGGVKMAKTRSVRHTTEAVSVCCKKGGRGGTANTQVISKRFLKNTLVQIWGCGPYTSVAHRHNYTVVQGFLGFARACGKCATLETLAHEHRKNGHTWHLIEIKTFFTSQGLLKTSGEWYVHYCCVCLHI